MDKESALRLFKALLASANEAGITDAWFPGFGTLLGIVRENDFIEHDDDLDMCILADHITKEQGQAYYDACNKRGLFKFRRKVQRRSDNDRFLWFSLKGERKGVKSCNWFFFEHNNYSWHSKGRKWAFGPKFKASGNIFKEGDYEARGKGIPSRLFENMVMCPFKFHGLKFKIPEKYGSILDNWYPGWKIPKRGGCSRQEADLYVTDWRKPKKWRTIIP